jgi:hypothetical protein
MAGPGVWWPPSLTTREAADAATLLTVLVGAGNMLGAGPHAVVQADRHPMRENALLVGTTSKGRKGLSASTPREIFRRVDPTWRGNRAGLSSGEGLIYIVRDARSETQPIKERGRVVEYQNVIVDGGVDDKRAFLLESEFAGVLRRMESDGNSLSAVIRQAWDSGDLETVTKNSPTRATGAHVSILGHITREELVASGAVITSMNPCSSARSRKPSSRRA